ncbi:MULTISPECIES: diacylglycerol kinase [Comamonas]|jgi:diacylglycerol kinase (ATP)|uniref:Diacylglycerol kinase n=2 Tax=Comamonas TaxID=283 RepID=A0A076PMR7_COMTE|nr:MULTISPECIES: diacylglycerol kinase [Comamonas]AIJ47013.1 diacylglycerol kinase [Comamonas testosteroni TK102]MPS89481.1 diacylglycerol kinase [Comamonas sp.]TYK70003.1 diacylglycerol kinase [Comamonas sp. Z3]TZG06757.1 diacylglycerol kinase [Comamonas thiooxydans]UNV88701.1 diacylglycerol kinase [Comamonas sp. 7D-2evo1]
MENNSKANIFNNIQKNRKGFSRVWHASKYSWSGIKDAWLEPAFRLEVILFMISLPLAQLIGRSMMEKLLLISCIWFLMIVEVINSAIESAIDRVGFQYHELSRKAKDLGSASVLMTIIFCLVVWGSLIYKNTI